MGLSKDSTGSSIHDIGLTVRKNDPSDRVIALAGNPNVGKSTVFNELTGLHQHTGNWPGKTVANAQGYCSHNGRGYVLVDIPGAYSLMAQSQEEEVARDFICFGGADAVVVVCDATCLERNLNLLLQVMEITPHVAACVNLLDEAKKKDIRVDMAALERLLHIPVAGASARSGKGLSRLLDRMEDAISNQAALEIPYPAPIEKAIAMVEEALPDFLDIPFSHRWLSLQLLLDDQTLLESVAKALYTDFTALPSLQEALRNARAELEEAGFSDAELRQSVVQAIYRLAESACREAVSAPKGNLTPRQLRIDRMLTSRFTGIPLMLALLAVVFYLTITGANYPSQLLSQGFSHIEGWLSAALYAVHTPPWLHDMLVLGIFRVLGWVVSVMLPPMAIFFPLFTLLEDVGYLPRVAFNLDHCFQRCHACGKQCLTMAMGFGCNAAGVIGCRIIDSPRERLIAILTNNFVPCNGRFPTLITLITIFFAGGGIAALQSVKAAALLTLVILLGIGATFLSSRLLSQTVLKGVPSSYTLELPPYRRPQIGKVLVRSIFDRTLFVLGRAAAVAAPAGLVIWLMANVTASGQTLLTHFTQFLDPFGRLLGMDGVILMGFILGFPANEIVIPLILMAYMSGGSLVEFSSLGQLQALLVQNGWTGLTALCTILFALMHWPCSTTLWTIGKETQSVKWTLAAFLLPTLAGMAVCFITACAGRLLGL